MNSLEDCEFSVKSSKEYLITRITKTNYQDFKYAEDHLLLPVSPAILLGWRKILGTFFYFLLADSCFLFPEIGQEKTAPWRI